MCFGQAVELIRDVVWTLVGGGGGVGAELSA